MVKPSLRLASEHASTLGLLSIAPLLTASIVAGTGATVQNTVLLSLWRLGKRQPGIPKSWSSLFTNFSSSYLNTAAETPYFAHPNSFLSLLLWSNENGDRGHK